MPRHILICQSQSLNPTPIASSLNGLFTVRIATTMSEAQSLINDFAPDTVICGDTFAGVSPYRLSEEVKSHGKGKLLIILPEGRNEIYNTSANGGSDVIFSPFSDAELLTRINMLCSDKTVCENTVFKTGQMTVDYENCRVYICEKPLHLTMLEYKLICLLSQNCNSVVSYERIMRELWQTPIGNEIQSLRVFVNAIRRKIRQLGDNTDYIQTRMGQGYITPIFD